MKKISFTLLALAALLSATAQHRATFDDLGLAPNSYWNGSDLSGGFLDGDAYFTNNYDAAFFSWSGFAYSDIQVNPDSIHTGAGDVNYQYSVSPVTGVYGSNTYGICYTGNSDAIIRMRGFALHQPVLGMFVTNTNFDFLSMSYGDTYAKKFGGATGMDSDWFLLTAYGYYQGAIVDSAQFYLADFRSPDTTRHYILHTWQFFDLQGLGNMDSLYFNLTSSDTGQFGMNTPAYFALDNFITTDGVIFAAPIAVPDTVSLIYFDSAINQIDTAVVNILANDTFSAFLAHTVTIISGPEIVGAVAYLDSANNLYYIPALGIQTSDTVIYMLCDERDSCSSAAVAINVYDQANNGINIIGSASMYLYPNPAETLVTVSSQVPIESVLVSDISGRQVLEQGINKMSGSLDVSGLSPGVYTVLIHTADGTVAKRLVRE